MKLMKITKLSPERLFGSKKSFSRSDLPSFSSGSMSSSSSEASSSVHKRGSSYRAPDSSTPVSVLPGEWSDTEMNFELLRFRSSSKSIDRDGGFGLVSRAELEALLSLLGAEPPLVRDEAALMLREAGSSDAEWCLSVDDLLGRVGSMGGPVCDTELRETFDFFDGDHDGRISAEELMGVFTTVLGDEGCTLEDCRRMIAEVDRSGDGSVCFEDFARMMELQI